MVDVARGAENNLFHDGFAPELFSFMAKSFRCDGIF